MFGHYLSYLKEIWFTLLYSDGEYNAFYANLRRNVRIARRAFRSSRPNRRSMRKTRRRLSKARDLRNAFVSVASQLVCEISGTPVGEFELRNSIAVRRGEAYRDFLQDNDRDKYDQKSSELKSELTHSLGLGFPEELIYPLPLYLGSEEDASSGKWFTLYGGFGTHAISTLGDVRIESLDDHKKRVIISSDILKRSDLFFLVSDRFMGDVTKMRLISRGTAHLSKVANGYSVGGLSLGGEYKTPCYCTDCPGTNINSNCASGCCTTPD